MKRVLYAGPAVVAIVLLTGAPVARAANVVQFGFGKMKNLNIDLVFWGWGNVDVWQDPQAQQVFTQVKSIASWLNTGGSIDEYGNFVPPTPGMEAAIHTYGVSGITPGFWVADPTPINPKFINGMGTSQPTASDLFPEVHVAWEQIGDMGLAIDFNGNAENPNTWGLTAGSNRLALVITKGTNTYNNNGNACGFHNSDSGHPWGAVMFECLVNTLSHEIMEAMTNPFPAGTADEPGWFAVTDSFFGWDLNSDEVADECEHLPGAGNTPVALIDVDPTYDVPDFFASANQSCVQNIPEEHAPMAMTLWYPTGQQMLNLVYVDTNGHVQELIWDFPGQPPYGPFDRGYPPTGPAVGKPSIVANQAIGGERIFVKGADQAVWMYYNGAWTSLGGLIYGDPKAVVWSWQGDVWTHVFALGTDDNLWGNGIPDTAPYGYGWGAIPNAGTQFVSSPAVISRDGTSLDLFAIGEDGTVKEATYNPSTGWGSPITRLGTCCVTAESAFTQTPSAAVSPNGTTVLAAGLLNGVVSTAFTTTDGAASNAWWGGGAMDVSGNGNYGFTGRSLQGSVAFLPDDNSNIAAFAVSRQGELWYWWNFNNPISGGWTNGTNGPLVASNGGAPATGDPLAVSRYSNEIEVFYRTASGQLAHLTFANGWQPVQILLPPGSIR